MSDDSLMHLEPEEEGIYLDEPYGVEPEIKTSEDMILTPFDPTEIRFDIRIMTLDLLVARLRENEINLKTEFQREAGIWTKQAESRLIESILLRIPLPAFYVDASDDDRWLVVDGLQRFTTIKRFIIDGTLILSGLEFLTDQNGKTYNDLSRGLQRRTLETQVTVYLIARGTPVNVKFNIFKRINTGGLPLSSQEIRHALFQGKATKLLASLVELPEFKNNAGKGISGKRMADREFVLRFLAFALTSYENYPMAETFDDFLNNAMKRMNSMTDERLEELRDRLIRSLTAATGIFGPDAFRKPRLINETRKPINKPLFEAWSVNLDSLSDEQLKLLENRRDLLTTRFARLVKEEPDFDASISLGTGDPKKIRLRFVRISEIIAEVLL